MGRVWRSLKLGLKSLLLHKLRSGLTVLGIVFGVGAVIAMMALSEGKSREAQKVIRELGATNIILRSVKPVADAAGGGPRVLNYGLKYADFDRITETLPNIKRSLPIRELRKEVRRGARFLEGRVVGTTQDYLEFNSLRLAGGRFLLPRDNDRSENVAVLAHETAKILFPYEDPIGQSVRIGTDYYTVVGVTRERASSGNIGGSLTSIDYNKDVYIPINTCKSRFGELNVSRRSGSFEAEEIQLTQITLQVETMDEVLPTSEVIKGAYEPWHPKQDVEMTIPYDLLLAAQREALQGKLLLGFIAAISLLVGGIGIMNIMLATVTERTREIGIRRALGAKRRDITQQFLIETVVLSGVGGLLGIAVGVTLPFVIERIFVDQKTYVTIESVVLAFSISVLVGLAAGLYPAMRAAQMDPIEALRHE